MKVAIIIPAFNEELSIAGTIVQYRSVFPNACIVVIDNNSTDGTSVEAALVLDQTRDVLISEKRQGKGQAVKTGLSRVDADIYIMTDADLTYNAGDALHLLELMIKNRVDMIVGDRVSNGAYAEQNIRRGHAWGNLVLSWIISKLAGQEYHDVMSGLRIISRPFISAFDVRSDGFQLETELNVISAYLRASVIEVPICYSRRSHGSHSKLNTLKDGYRILNFAVTNWVAFSPLQPFMLISAVTFFVTIILGYRVVSGFLTTGWPYTTTATAAVACAIISILSLFQGISLKILGRNDRRREVAAFLEAKRHWNASLDKSIL